MYLKAIWWAVALGLVLGGAIDYYVPREYISKILAGKSPSAILNAVFLGFLMSACSHGIIALAMGAIENALLIVDERHPDAKSALADWERRNHQPRSLAADLTLALLTAKGRLADLS